MRRRQLCSSKASLLQLGSQLLLLLVAVAAGFENGPKLFVDVDCISYIDPLVKGFQVIMPEHFVQHYLNAVLLPTVYLSAIPLNPQRQRHSRVLFREDIQDNSIRIEQLHEQSWYFICVEFENIIRHQHHRGNTSTSCQLVRTLDRFGKTADGFVTNVQIGHVDHSSIELQMSVDGGSGGDSDIPLQIVAYLEQGSVPIQSYMVRGERSIRVLFTHLSPGFNYGRLCLIEQPLSSTHYTTMGRTVGFQEPSSALKTRCFFDSLSTQSTAGANSEKSKRVASNDADGIDTAVRSSSKWTNRAVRHRHLSIQRVLALICLQLPVLYAFHLYISR